MWSQTNFDEGVGHELGSGGPIIRIWLEAQIEETNSFFVQQVLWVRWMVSLT